MFWLVIQLIIQRGRCGELSEINKQVSSRVRRRLHDNAFGGKNHNANQCLSITINAGVGAT